MLTRIRNANLAKYNVVEVPNTKINHNIAKVLQETGFIQYFKFELKGKLPKHKIVIYLKYKGKIRQPVITSIKRISKPGLRIYASCNDIPIVLGGLGIAIISTSKGIMADKDARSINIGKLPIIIPDDIYVHLNSNYIIVRGPQGELKKNLVKELSFNLKKENNKSMLFISRKKQDNKSNQLYGLYRTLINNMVVGVNNKFIKELELKGVGYRCQIDDKLLILNVGYSHPIKFQVPESITIEVENNTTIKISGIDKQLVGEIASRIRSFRMPEPYKGKGIHYKGEHIKLKKHKSIRKKIKGDFNRPRLYVFRSNEHIYAQVINDETNNIITSSSSLESLVKNKVNKGYTCQAAEIVGMILAKKCTEKNIVRVRFDRGGRKYHGRIKALAESARKNGLIF
eukprot:jgi/Galph1/4609/GphlegSOOS_G3252.1